MFNVDGAAKGKAKPWPAGISGPLCNSEGIVLAMFSKHVGILASNKSEVMAILAAI